MHSLKQTSRKLLRTTGFDLIRYPPPFNPCDSRSWHPDNFNTNLVLDVGANIGQYGQHLRHIGYRGRILSFEPTKQAFRLLDQVSRRDGNWRTQQMALGESRSSTTINISANSVSSSILPMLSRHTDAEPGSSYVGTEEIDVRRLDEVVPPLLTISDRVWLKIDTQGYELAVMRGATGILGQVAIVQLEVSLVPLYEGAPTFEGVRTALAAAGFIMVAVGHGFADTRNDEVLQIDGLFRKRNS